MERATSATPGPRKKHPRSGRLLFFYFFLEETVEKIRKMKRITEHLRAARTENREEKQWMKTAGILKN